MKCDEKATKAERPFEPESPYVVVCEGLHEANLACALLEDLGISNCDVTFPKKPGGNSGIKAVVALLAGRADDLKGVFVVMDADTDAARAFADACATYAQPFQAPKAPFRPHQGKRHRTGIFLMPGAGQTGTLEDLLYRAASAKSPAATQCIAKFETEIGTTTAWTDNKKAKMRFACYVATHCKNDPCCGTGFIWRSKNNLLDIRSVVFDELRDFLSNCSAE